VPAEAACCPGRDAGGTPERYAADVRNAERAEHVFVVRIWHESGREADPTWRGAVTLVATGELFYFTGLGHLTDFISKRLYGDRVKKKRQTDCESTPAI
jgi:hypothetical protein